MCHYPEIIDNLCFVTEEVTKVVCARECTVLWTCMLSPNVSHTDHTDSVCKLSCCLYLLDCQSQAAAVHEALWGCKCLNLQSAATHEKHRNARSKYPHFSKQTKVFYKVRSTQRGVFIIKLLWRMFSINKLFTLLLDFGYLWLQYP